MRLDRRTANQRNEACDAGNGTARQELPEARPTQYTGLKKKTKKMALQAFLAGQHSYGLLPTGSARI